MTQSIPQLPELLPCPFCNHPVPKDLSDTLYPSGGYWRESEFGRHYFGIKESRDGDGECWAMHCTENMGGCGAQISGDSMEEAIAKWNTRASLSQPMGEPVPEGVPSDVGFKIVSAWLQQEGTAARGDQLYTMNRFADFVLAHAPQPMGVAGIPPGMALVPIELSAQIRNVLIDRCDKVSQGRVLLFTDIWRDILAAAPQPPAGQQDREHVPEAGKMIAAPETGDSRVSDKGVDHGS